MWNVLTAVGQRTDGDLGPGVTCPSFRIHPAMVAQAAATSPRCTPIGTGSVSARARRSTSTSSAATGRRPERINRMFEAIEMIQKLFTGKDVKHAGELFKLDTTRLWTLPETPPPIYVATAGPITAKTHRRRCDGIITPGATTEKVARSARPSSTKAPRGRQGSGDHAQAAAASPVLGAHRRGGTRQRDDRVAQRRHEVPQAGHPLAASTSSRWPSSSAPRTSRAAC